MSQYLAYDMRRCFGENCDRKMQCLRFLAPGNRHTPYDQFDPVDCYHFIAVK